MEARANLGSFYLGGRHICELAPSGRKTPRQVRTILDFSDGQRDDQLEFFPICPYTQLALPFFFLRYPRRDWQRVRLFHRSPSNGQVVPRKNRPRKRTCASRIWGGLSYFWNARQFSFVSALRLACLLHGTWRNFSGHDDGRGLPSKEPSG